MPKSEKFSFDTSDHRERVNVYGAEAPIKTHRDGIKYEIQKQEHQLPDGRKVHRIKALRDFGNVKAGTIGGFVEADDNLSHSGNCWISGDAMALGRSRITRDAQLRDRARLEDRACITGRSVVRDDARLRDFVFVYDNAVIGAQSVLAEVVTVRDNAIVLCRNRFSVSGKSRVPNLRGNAIISDHARLEGSISVRDDVSVGDHAIVRDHARLLEKASVGGHAIIEDRATVGEEAMIRQHARIGGRSKVFGRTCVTGKVAVLGKSLLICRVYLCGHGTIVSEHLSGEEFRRLTDPS